MIICTLTSEKFLSGTRTLLYSLVRNGSLSHNTRLLVLYRDGTSFPDSYCSSIRNMVSGFDLEFLNVRTLGGKVMVPLRHKVGTHAEAIDKLLVFNFSTTEKICFLGSDMLCLNPIDDVYTMPHFSAAPDLGCSEPTIVSGYPMFNSDFMVLRPSKDLFLHIKSFAENSKVKFELSDQGVLNRYFYEFAPESVNLVDSSWNMLKRVKHNNPSKFDLKNTKFLQFVGRKPWTLTPKRILYQTLTNKKSIPINYREIRDYAGLNTIWWKHYFLSRRYFV